MSLPFLSRTLTLLEPPLFPLENMDDIQLLQWRWELEETRYMKRLYHHVVLFAASIFLLLFLYVIVAVYCVNHGSGTVVSRIGFSIWYNRLSAQGP